MSEVIILGHNAGQWGVKDTYSVDGKTKIARPYPAVIAPWGEASDLGFGGKTKALEATVSGRRYIVGEAAQRHAMAMRQMSQGRLDADSPIYPVLLQASLSHTGILARKNGTAPQVIIAVALPIGWKDAQAEQQIERHVRDGARNLVTIKAVHVSSEPAAVVFHELFNDEGVVQKDQIYLNTGLVCVADIGGSTLNRSVLDGLRLEQDGSASPYLGSYVAIEQVMQRLGIHQAVDAEKKILKAVKGEATDPVVGEILNQYREAVVAELQQAWKRLDADAYLIAGGTSWWVIEEVKRAFGAKVRHVPKPQTAISTGLYRYARFKQGRSGRDG